MNDIILVHYVNCKIHGTEYINNYIDAIKGNQCMNYVFPIYKGETRIECINPKLLKDNEYQTILDKLDEMRIKNEEFLNNKIDE